MSQVKPRRIGDQLVDVGIITQDQLKIALIEQKTSRDQIGKILVRLGFMTEENLRQHLGQSLGHESVDLKLLVPDASALELVDQQLARQLKVLPTAYDRDKKRLSLAMSDTFNIIAIDRIAATIDNDIEIDTLLASESDLDQAIDTFYGYDLSIDGILQELESGKSQVSISRIEQEEHSHPLVRLIDALLSDAVKMRASDIHFEPEDMFLRIRYRIDGVLQQIRSLHKNFWSAMVVRLKVMSSMNIAETRSPQDGRISLTIGSNLIDFRVSSQPTIHGENIVLRILDRNKGIVPIDQLQLSKRAFTQLQLMMSRPEGIIMVTGPTGSGKTTTLYSILNHLNEESVNIMTLEDPVEYPLSMVRQSSVNASVKMDFADGIRSLMRQDPDIILVGEIRDVDTATMAFRAAMTGHQVYSTLHTNSATAAFPRLLDIGVKSSVMTENVIGIIGQRLVRKVCGACKNAYVPNDIEKKVLGVGKDDSPLIYKAIGCESCNHTGYKGRAAIMEVLRIDTDLDILLSRGASPIEIEQAAASNGFESLADDGIRKILEGLTTLDELSRVVNLTHRLDRLK